MFVDSWDIDAAICIALCSSLGLNAERFAADIDSSSTTGHITDSAREAFERGAFGVPTFFVGDQMYWGNDRLVLVEHALK